MKILYGLGLIVFVFVSFAFTSSSAFAQLANDWPTFQRDPQHTGFNSLEFTLTPPLTLLWSLALDTTPSGYPGIVSSNGTLFAKSNSGILYAIDSSSGNIKWTAQTQASGGIAISGNTVYAGNNCDNCTLDAFNATTGQLIWSTPPLSKGALGVNVVNDKVFFGSNAHNIHAVDTTTGNILWKTPLSDGTVGVPAVANGIVYIGSFCCTLYALDASTGSVIWSRSNLGGVFFSSPTIANGVLYIGSGTAQVFAVNASNGNTIWSFGPTEDSVWSTPAVANNIVYVQTLVGRLYAINAISGTQIWTHKTQSANNEISPQAIANGVVYQTSFDNNIYALGAQTGNVIWQYTTDGSVYSPIVADGKLFITSQDGKIYAFESSSSDLQVPQLKQTSTPWGSQIYDSANIWSPSNPTINSWGCAVTSAAMVFKYHGVNKLPDGTSLDPGSLNNWLKNQPDGYIRNGWVNWLVLTRLSRLAKSINGISSFNALEYRRVNSYSSTQLTTDINNGIPGILEEPGHFIVGKGISGSTFNINDPYYPKSTLNDYGNTFLSLGRFIPSSTDLSYIMLVTDPGINIVLKDSTGNLHGEQFIQQPLIDDLNRTDTNGFSVKFFYSNKPPNGQYQVELTSENTQNYDIKMYLYDKSGNVNIFDQSGLTSQNSSDTFSINFDSQTFSNSSSQKIVIFQSLIDDIKEAHSLNLAHKSAAKVLTELAKSAKSDYEKGESKIALIKLQALEKLLTAFHRVPGEFLIHDNAYQILLYDVNYLKTHI